MFEGMLMNTIESLVTEKILTPEKISAAKSAIVQRIAEEKLVENTVDSLVDILVTSVTAFLPKGEK
jgi:hypothetical protein